MRVSVPQNPPCCLSFCPSSGALLSAHQLHPGHRFCLCFCNSTTWYCKGVLKQSYLPATSVMRTPPAFSSYSLSVLAHPKKNSNLAFCSFRPGRHWLQYMVGCGLILYLYRPSSIKIFWGYGSLSCTSISAKWLWLLKFVYGLPLFVDLSSVSGSGILFAECSSIEDSYRYRTYWVSDIVSVLFCWSPGLSSAFKRPDPESNMWQWSLELLLHNAGSWGTCVGLLQYTTVGVLFSKLIFHACCTHIQ